MKTLKDKMWDESGKGDYLLNGDDLKQAIKDLKDEITNSQLGWEGYTPEDVRIAKEVNLIIDKIMGVWEE